MYIYLILLAIFFILPILFLWTYFLRIIKNYKHVFILVITSTFIFGVPWDILSVRTGLWRYDSSPTLGIWFFGSHQVGLPLEEIMFTFLCPLLVTTFAILVERYLRRYVW